MATQSGRDVHLENVTGEQRQSRALLDSRADLGKAAVLDSDKTVKTGGAACAGLHGVVSARSDKGVRGKKDDTAHNKQCVPSAAGCHNTRSRFKNCPPATRAASGRSQRVRVHKLGESV